MADFNIKEIDFNAYGNWPIPVKAIAIALVCAIALGVGYWYDTKVQLEALQKEEETEKTLRQQFTSRQRQANSLEKLKEQLAEIENSFGELLKRLPNKTEVDDLLVDISRTGLASGLTFDVFKPQGERTASGGFYKELPISLKLSGDYHAFGKFVSDVASLPRIVTQHNISITRLRKEEGSLIFNTTAKTYRYVEQE
ncbi:MAG: type 4a pilus biogenesis protein PilO [Gammaproteobacteria bacterium]|nr:type 4a pilus biogenesis protein PilO [Gammaproteobacteria bacterium]